MTWMKFAIIAISSYLLGSLNFSIIICRLTMNQDIRDYGSGNAGLTNSYRIMGASKTLGVLLGDIAKGAAAVTIGALLCGPIGKLTAGVFVIAGHMFPVYFGFRGGKGVLVGAVMLVLFDWRIFLIALTLFLIAVISTRWISLGSVLGATSCPITTWFFYHDTILLAMVFGMAVAVVFMHRSNIMRMLQGTENKFAFQHKTADNKKAEKPKESRNKYQ